MSKRERLVVIGLGFVLFLLVAQIFSTSLLAIATYCKKPITLSGFMYAGYGYGAFVSLFLAPLHYWNENAEKIKRELTKMIILLAALSGLTWSIYFAISIATPEEERHENHVKIYFVCISSIC